MHIALYSWLEIPANGGASIGRGSDSSTSLQSTNIGGFGEIWFWSGLKVGCGSFSYLSSYGYNALFTIHGYGTFKVDQSKNEEVAEVMHLDDNLRDAGLGLYFK